MRFLAIGVILTASLNIFINSGVCLMAIRHYWKVILGFPLNTLKLPYFFSFFKMLLVLILFFILLENIISRSCGLFYSDWATGIEEFKTALPFILTGTLCNDAT